MFHRTYDHENDASIIEFGSKVKINKIAREGITAKLLKNVSFFVGYNQVNYTNSEIDKANLWLKNKLVHIIRPSSNYLEYTKGILKDNPALKEFTIRFMKNAQYNISDIVIESRKKDDSLLQFLKRSEKQNISSEADSTELLDINPIDYLMKISKKDKALFEHEIINANGEKESYNLSEDHQSAGTMRYYSFSAPLYQAFQNNAFLAIDEIEASLHPHLVKHLVREFLMEGRQHPGAQMLFTTHDIALLQEKDLLRKDAIWFTEKREDGSTDLYSMADFDIRKELSFFKAYNAAKFGAIPNVD